MSAPTPRTPRDAFHRRARASQLSSGPSGEGSQSGTRARLPRAPEPVLRTHGRLRAVAVVPCFESRDSGLQGRCVDVSEAIARQLPASRLRGERPRSKPSSFAQKRNHRPHLPFFATPRVCFAGWSKSFQFLTDSDSRPARSAAGGSCAIFTEIGFPRRDLMLDRSFPDGRGSTPRAAPVVGNWWRTGLAVGGRIAA